MKKKFLMLIALLAGVASTYADDMFTVTSAGIPKGAQGTIAIGLPTTNTNTYAAFQITLVLPEGLEFKSAENGDLLSTHSISFSGTTTVKISGSATPTTNFTDTSGTLCVLTVSADANAATGNLTIKAGGDFSLLTYYNGTNDILGFDETHEITITDDIILDENSTVLPAEQENVDVKVMRKLKGGYWNTICLPFATTVGQLQTAIGNEAIFCGLTACNQNGNSFSLSFTTLSATQSLPANFPMLVKTTADVESFTINGVSISNKNSDRIIEGPQDITGERPILAKFIGTHIAGTTIPENYIFLGAGDNKFYYSTGNTTIKGFRGYFYVAGFEPSSSAPQLSLVIDGETTSVLVIRNDSYTTTMEGTYNLNGQRVETPAKGVYIQNGKKVIIK